MWIGKNGPGTRTLDAPKKDCLEEDKLAQSRENKVYFMQPGYRVSDQYLVVNREPIDLHSIRSVDKREIPARSSRLIAYLVLGGLALIISLIHFLRGGANVILAVVSALVGAFLLWTAATNRLDVQILLTFDSGEVQKHTIPGSFGEKFYAGLIDALDENNPPAHN